MERNVDELFESIFEEGCSLAVSQVNSHIYITNEFGTQVFSQTGEHLLDFYRVNNRQCSGSGIAIYENFVIVSTLNASNGFLQIFTLDGFLITMLYEFRINGIAKRLKDPMGVLMDKAGNELALFLCDPHANNVYCSTPLRHYSVCNGELDRPRDIRSSSYELFIVLDHWYHHCVMVDKFDVCVTLSLISFGFDSYVTRHIRNRLVNNRDDGMLHFFCVNPMREEIYISKCSKGLLEVFSWNGCHIGNIYSDLLLAKNCFLQQGLSIDGEGNVFVLIDSRVVRIEMSCVKSSA